MEYVSDEDEGLSKRFASMKGKTHNCFPFALCVAEKHLLIKPAVCVINTFDDSYRRGT